MSEQNEMNEEQINNKFVDMIMEEEWDMDFSDIDTSYIVNEYVIPMPSPQLYILSPMPPELIEELFGDILCVLMLFVTDVLRLGDDRRKQ